MVDYERVLTYRAVERKVEDNREITREDFKSYFELGVYKEGGPQETKDQHVCWWLYQDADVSGFKLRED